MTVTVGQVIYCDRVCWAIFWPDGTWQVPFLTEAEAKEAAGV